LLSILSELHRKRDLLKLSNNEEVKAFNSF